MTSSKAKRYGGSTLPRRPLVLALALGLGLASSGIALAQSNATGVIFGQAAPGETIHIESTQTGLKRDLTTDAQGRYRAASLPIGTYNVSVMKDGKVLDSRNDVQTTISSGTEVSFNASAANAQTLGAVQVVGNVLPAIDVSSVDSRAVLTADQLAKLPIARTSISSIALLAPGTTPAARGYGNALSFGGSSASENAYYINGFSATNPLTGVSSRQLPYDAIDQEQVLIGGYGAEYGRSTGGVINVVTKRGTNQWKGDVQAFWSPSDLAQQPRNVYRRNGTLYQVGNAFSPRDRDELQYSGSIGGALIKDKLFFFGAADAVRQTDVAYGTQSNNSTVQNDTNKITRWLTKFDWNITDNHILEFTGIGDDEQTDSQIYGYNYSTLQNTGYKGHQYTKNYNGTQTNGTPGGNIYIGHYTGYITDDLTVNAMYGKSNSDHMQNITGAGGTPCPAITDNRAIAATNPAPSCQFGATTTLRPGSKDKTSGWSFNIEYRLGSHDFRGGMDNYTLRATWGSAPVTGTGWRYFDLGSGQAITQRLTNLGLSPSLYNPASFANGYYAESTGLSTGTSARTAQRSEFIEDHWQLTDRWNIYLGLRNEQFTNYNGVGAAYAKERNQLDPRLGFAWDVYGDSSLKVYGNAGRYHLGLPTSVAVRGAGPSTFPSTYYSFTSIDPVTGVPQGLSVGAPWSQTFYNNGANGTPPDAKTVSVKDLKTYYQDEYILGFDKQLPNNWTVGAKAMFRTLRNLIDDDCDSRPIQAWGDAHGMSAAVAAGIANSTQCWLYNPGNANTFILSPAAGQYFEVPLTAREIGEPKAKRRYYMLDMYAEHQFSDKWYAKVEYTFSRSYGNSEGQLDSDIVQADVSTTESWDAPELMENTNGPLANDQTHQLRILGVYQPTPEWRLSTVTRIASGTPISCIGARPESAGGDPVGYQAAYFWCNGKPAGRGSYGRTPWTYTINLSAAWQPAFLDHKLTLSADVFNLLGKQRITQLNETCEDPSGNTTINCFRPRSFQDPRYVRLGARYDFSL
ncbi:carboxypeptidase regulatory-like domain-containing protein [Dyella sp. LX-66]|uniref:TonB-dependent receptor n=1 Tax=unclassified Dyella TaxID=2634549 RepID=UPI001BDFA1B8|nr:MULTISPECIES: TonB-dependent receptor [unclassified Dyella]MBT2115855.1 carboxypeptidase regulatory-like domain-containing protein [Dyella sp. LX-1]MBT2139670.1 carboxypeptidase regulatory-like domain-containing protein [Dyella sp. LX-66]